MVVQLLLFLPIDLYPALGVVLPITPKWNTLSVLVASYQSQKGLGAQEEGDLSKGNQRACINPTEKEAGARLKSQLRELC